MTARGVEIFAAGSRDALANLLRSEETKWNDFFPGLILVHPSGQYRIAPTYSEITSRVDALDPQGDLAIEIGDNRSLGLLPPFNSPEGKVLQSIAADIPLVMGFLTAYFVSYGWLKEPVIYEGTIRSSDASAGRALLAATQTTSAEVLGRTSSIVKTEIAAIEQATGLLQARQADFEASLLSGEQQLRTHVDAIASQRIAVRKLTKRFLRRFSADVKEQEEIWQNKFDAAYQAYVKKLQFDESATLWSNSAEKHREKAAKAFFYFWAGMVVIAAAAIATVYCLGPSIAGMFQSPSCTTGDTNCDPRLSLEGPLFVGAFLLTLSLAIWGLRLINRIHLSERNLAQSAEEKKAFVKTYLALTKEGNLNPDQGAIVLGAIFRPTSDGYVSDDSSSVDISAAAVLARVLSGKN